MKHDKDEVQTMARLGWQLMPIATKQKNPGSLLGSGWQDQASNDPEQIDQWVAQYSQCNWGVLLGEVSGIIDVEDDSPEGRNILETAMESCAVRTPCYTSGKSIHRLFKYDERIHADSCSVMQAFGTEWRFGKTPAQSIVPPSVHESGKRYQWLPGLSPDEVEVARLPDAMWQLFLDLRILDGKRKAEEREKKRSQTKSEKKPVPASMQLRIGGHTTHVPAAEELIEMYPWEKLLTDQGWQAFGEDDWTRPGKDWSNARSATLLHSDNRFHVWSNAAPIAEGHYSKWRFWYQSHGFNDHEQIEAAKAFLGDERTRQIDAAFRRENKLKENTAAEQESRPQPQSCLTFHDAWKAAEKPRPMRECIIQGLLRRGEVGNFIASTKTGKSWFALMLLICIATGRDWLGRRVARGNVLLIDNELHEETLENRIAAVNFAMEISPEAQRDQFEYVACRGNWISIQDLIEALPSRYPPGSLNMIVIDAKYRLFGNGLEENSNDDQTTFHNMIDEFAGVMNCPIVLVHHSTKGDQTGKAVTDIGSGGGSQARTVDLHMVIRPHQQPGLAVLDATLRSFEKVDPMTLRWNWPLWTVANDVEPVLPTNAKDGKRYGEMKARVLKYLTSDWQSLTKLAERCSTKKDRNPFADIIDELQRENQAELSEAYTPPRSNKETTGIRLTSDKTTSDKCPGSLSDVRG